MEAKEMGLSEYQEICRRFDNIPAHLRIIYPALGLNGEAGELAEKVKKMYRDDNGRLTESRRQQIIGELGDVLWYVAICAHDIGVSLDEVAHGNVEKLTSRLERGKIGGDGDNR